MFSSNTSAVSGDVNYIEDVFSSYLTTGAGSNITVVNGIDLAGKGGLVWNKTRSTSGYHTLFDTVRGVNKAIYSNDTAAQATSSNWLPSFNSDGFVIGTDNNLTTSGTTGVSWTFRKQPKFFDVVTFTANGSNPQTISHSLGSTPGCIIVKSTDNTASWLVYHRGLSDPNNQLLNLNGTGAIEANSGYWGSGPTSTTFQMNTAGISGWNFVAYVFAHNAGGFGLTGTDNVISCGSFTGLATVDLGWEPQWILYKTSGSANSGWLMVDNMRGFTAAGGADPYLEANSSAAEQGGNDLLTITSTGFKNNLFSGDTFIYIAIRRGPMKVPTDGTKVFEPATRTGTGANATVTTGISPVDMAWAFNRNGTLGQSTTDFDRLRGALNVLYTGATSAEFSAANTLTGFDVQNGYRLGSDSSGYGINYSGATFVNYNFRRAPGFFDEVCYTGNGTAGTTYTHNLGVAPELWIVKKRSAAGSWTVGSTSIANSEVLYLQATDAKTSNTAAWNSTYPSSTVLTVGNSGNTNGSGSTYVAYLFATCPGVSKVGSYTGTGTTQTINCGFAAGARFVMIKRTDDAASWYVWDTARGMVSGTDPSLQINWYSGEVAGDSVYTVTTGFQIVASPFVDVNTNGGSYIYLAIA